jgi:hypothetical protein
VMVGDLFRSADSGSRWTAMKAGLTGQWIMALAIDPAGPSTLYAGTEGHGVFRYADPTVVVTRPTNYSLIVLILLFFLVGVCLFSLLPWQKQANERSGVSKDDKGS